MKTKKERLEKIILSVLTFVLIGYITFNLMLLCIFNISEKFLNKDKVEELINKIDIITILKDELGNEVDEILLIENELKDIGVATEGINAFIDSPDVKNFSTNVVSGVFDKIINNNLDNYYIQDSDVSNLIENNIDKLQTNSSLTQSQILEKLNTRVPNLVSNINKLIDKLCEKLETSELLVKYQEYVNMSINVLDIVYSGITYFLIIFTLITFIALLIFIRRDIYKSLKWISISFVIPGLLIFILSYFLINKFIIDNILINNIIKIIVSGLNGYSFIYISIGAIIVIINIIIYFIKKYRNKN